jgi:hypothetical protein
MLPLTVPRMRIEFCMSRMWSAERETGLADTRVDSFVAVRRFKMLLDMLIIDASMWFVDELGPERHDLER